MSDRALSVSLALALALVSARAGADPEADRARAREAYDRGAAAHARGDHATAARELAKADAILPNPVTLQAALESALAAEDAVLAMTLAERAERAPAEGRLSALLRDARARFGKRVGRVRADCGACAVTIDGKPAEAGRALIVSPGKHVVTLRHDGQSEERALDVAPEITVTVTASAAPITPIAPVAPADTGPSLAWFLVPLGLTAAAGGGVIASGFDTAHRHTLFTDAGCSGPVHGDCSTLAGDGLAAQRRTNILIGVTSGLAAATIVATVLTLRRRNTGHDGAASGPKPRASFVGAERAAITVGVGPIAYLRVPLP